MKYKKRLSETFFLKKKDGLIMLVQYCNYIYSFSVGQHFDASIKLFSLKPNR